MVRRPYRLSNGDDPCLNDNDYVCGHRNLERLYEYGHIDSNSKPSSERTGELTWNMYRRQRYTDGHGSNELYVEYISIRPKHNGKPNEHDELYGNGYDEWLHQNGSSDGSGDQCTICIGELSDDL